MMRRLLVTLVTLVWGLWFGGLIVLFMAVTSLFSTFADRRSVAGQAASDIFRMFNRYQLVLAAITLIVTLALRLTGTARLTNALFTFFAIATVAACVVAGYFTAHIQALQAQGLTNSPQFARLHGYSMIAYLIETAAVLIAGLLLPATGRPHPIGGDNPREGVSS